MLRQCYFHLYHFPANNDPPAGVQVATFFNKDRDAINAAIFEQYCEENKPLDDSILDDAVVILMDNLEMQKSSKSYVSIVSNALKQFFWEHCSEHSCRSKDGKNRQKVDPVLKMYRNCPMMHSQNTDVLNGQANGSRVRVKSVRMKIGENPFPLTLECGTTVNGIFASQAEYIKVEHETTDICPRVFDVKLQNFSFNATIEVDSEKMNVGMCGTQFPLISNSATTGHKLQGCTIDSILVNNWKYVSNWAYVVLSRVRTMAGLYLREKLSTDLEVYKMPQAMKNMIQKFRDTVSLPDLSEEDYAVLSRVDI